MKTVIALMLISSALDSPASGQRGPEVIGALSQYLAGIDYPRNSLVAGASGRTVAQIALDERGRQTGCTIVSTSGDEQLDRKTCQIARKIRFRPAFDGSNRAVASTYLFPMRWQVTTPSRPAPSSLDTQP